MSLRDDAMALRAAKGPTCSVALLPDPLRADLESALADPAIRMTDLVKALANRDIRISAQTLSRHRAGECQCRRAA